jgi:hypothetical protein
VLYGVRLALEFGNADKVIVIGAPLDTSGHYWDGKGKPSDSLSQFLPGYKHGWEITLPKITNKVKSLSGWTQELLGTPTENWLNGID